MALVLQPSLDEHSREEIIAHIEQVRARRLMAALIYAQGAQEKRAEEASVIERKLIMEFERLARNIEQLDKYDRMATERLEKIAVLQHEYNLLVTFGVEE